MAQQKSELILQRTWIQFPAERVTFCTSVGMSHAQADNVGKTLIHVK